MRIGTVYRYPKPMRPSEPLLDGLPNFFFATAFLGNPALLLESGINAPVELHAPDGFRRPVILIRSSPHKAGSTTTPWQDHFDPANGHVRYFGDSKGSHDAATSARGNRLLLTESLHWLSETPDGRARACPVVFFEAVTMPGRAKGQVRFQGFGVLERAVVVAQVDKVTGISFSNYRYDFAVLALDDDSLGLDWSWINRRRDKTLTAAEADRSAPASWRRWKELGPSGLGTLRRRVSRLREIGKDAQTPVTRKDQLILDAVHRYYGDRKQHFFEGVAEVVTDHVLRREGLNYTPGWITRRGGDEGIDFVGRFDVGDGLAAVSVVVLGQAKCVPPGRAISGRDVARVVARLRRGWIGAFVTTGYFSLNVQREILEDEYPIMLLGGAQFARAISEILDQRGLPDATSLCSELEATYLERLVIRRPHEILLD